MLSELRKKYIVLGLSLVFVAVNTVLIANEFYWLSILPLAMILIYLFFFSLDKILMLVTVATPFSVVLSDTSVGMGLALPTEPLLVGMMLVFLLRFIYENHLDKRILFHPVTITVLIQLTWMTLTSITSEIPLVSFKYLISRLWFVIPLFFVAIPFFKKRKNITIYPFLYIVPLVGVVIYTTFRHMQYGFDGEAAHWVMSPFYNDHTAYGAILAMYVPISVFFVLDKEYSRSLRLVFGVLAVALIIGLIMSVSRAAWVSVVAAIGVYAMIKLKINIKWVIAGFVLLVGMFFAFQTTIIMSMEQNKQESEETDLSKHVQSISNISTDASNMERINRWQAAFRLFGERPMVGWGPGTYQFVYAPYQHSYEQTIISTNAGDRGSVHSEYFGPLCEQGVMGLLTTLAMFLSIVFTALRLIKKKMDERLRTYTIAYFLGLVTYMVHGVLNNFLETDKAAVPFWGFAAVLVAVDIYHSMKPEEESK